MVAEQTQNSSCPCPRVRCRRHGKCEECRKHHHRPDNLPYCERTAKEGK